MADTINVTIGNDTINATLGTDTINITIGDDTINAVLGDQAITATIGTDAINVTFDGSLTVRFVDADNKFYLNGNGGDSYFIYVSAVSQLQLFVNGSKKRAWA